VAVLLQSLLYFSINFKRFDLPNLRREARCDGSREIRRLQGEWILEGGMEKTNSKIKRERGMR